MLRATLDVNGWNIDELEIVRIRGNKHERCTYECRHEDRVWHVDHDYDDGAWRLMVLAINGMSTGKSIDKPE